MIPSPPLLLPLNGQVLSTVYRSVGGAYIKGVYQEDRKSEITLNLNIQPLAKGSDTLLVPEGDRYKEMIKVFCASELFARVEGDDARQGDFILYDGRTFEVMKVSTYKMGVLNHTEAIAVRRERT